MDDAVNDVVCGGDESDVDIRTLFMISCNIRSCVIHTSSSNVRNTNSAIIIRNCAVQPTAATPATSTAPVSSASPPASTSHSFCHAPQSSNALLPQPQKQLTTTQCVFSTPQRCPLIRAPGPLVSGRTFGSLPLDVSFV